MNSSNLDFLAAKKKSNVSLKSISEGDLLQSCTLTTI